MKPVTKFLAVLGSISTLAVFTGLYSSKITSKPANVDIQPELTCRFSGRYWNSDKVYILENNSPVVLTHLTIMSWSEQNLPILKITSSKASYVPAHMDSALPPPNELMPHHKAWFAGPRTSKTSAETFSVIWQNNGEAYYETIKDIS